VGGRPYSVVLLEEIEKAHSDVFNVLLQVMDDGRLTDGQGRTVDFKNTVLIMTSNVGSQYIVRESDEERIRDQVESALTAQFKPEFLNRVDDIVIFHRLTKDQIKQIVELQTRQLVERVRERGIEVELSDEAKELLANLGYDPNFGARPLKRVIQKRLVDRLALAVLEGRFSEGDVVEVDVADGDLKFHKREAPVAAAA
jgi:ATP-dependent Clp protease ATP-binding subunit ClpB